MAIDFTAAYRQRLQAERNTERLKAWRGRWNHYRRRFFAEHGRWPEDVADDEWMSATYRLIALRWRRDG